MFQTLFHVMHVSNTVPCNACFKHCSMRCMFQTLFYVMHVSNFVLCDACFKHCSMWCMFQTLFHVVHISNIVLCDACCKQYSVSCMFQTFSPVVHVSVIGSGYCMSPTLFKHDLLMPSLLEPQCHQLPCYWLGEFTMSLFFLHINGNNLCLFTADI